MVGLIETFHLDVKLLVAQVINFSVAFAVLYFFGLRPLFKAWRARSEKIAKSLADSRAIEEKLSQTEVGYKNEISKAKKEAREIMEKASVQAENHKKEMLAQTKEEIAQIITQERAKLAGEKNQILQDIKSEVASLITASVKKILNNQKSEDWDEDFINDILNDKK